MWFVFIRTFAVKEHIGLLEKIQLEQVRKRCAVRDIIIFMRQYKKLIIISIIEIVCRQALRDFFNRLLDFRSIMHQILVPGLGLTLTLI